MTGQTNMKVPSLENAHVFCISLNGVVEGHHFLTLISSPRHSSTPKNTKFRRSRTFSLPPSFETLNVDAGKQKDFVKLSRSSRSVSDDILRVLRQRQNVQSTCMDCVSGFKLYDAGTRKTSNRTTEFGIRKVKRNKNVIEKKKLKVISQPNMHKSLITRKKQESVPPCSGISFQMDGYMLSYFIGEMRRSATCRTSFVRCWSKENNRGGQHEGCPLIVFVALMKEPNLEVLDMLGNKMVNSNILFRRSLEHALSWLSTLGGAFSALGDLSPSWAEEAGHVSLTQLRISMKLGDPGIQSRCRLYASISLLQKGYLQSCRDIVRNEYQYAISLPEGSDPRLRRMCLGIWSKLQYHWNQVAKTDKRMLKPTLLDGLKDIQNNAKYRNVYDLEEGRRIATE